MRKRLALLSLLLLVSVASAVAASASGTLRILAGKDDVKIDADEVLIYIKLSPEQKEKAIEIALGDPQVQEMLEGADDYTIEATEHLDIQEITINFTTIGPTGISMQGIQAIALSLKEHWEGLALVKLRIYKDYDEELGVKEAMVDVDLLKEEVMHIYPECPEIRKPKIHEGTVSTDELLGNPSKYDDQVVTVSGEVSKLGEVREPYFMLDEKIRVCYVKEDNTFIDISNVKNGDYVTVTGRFWAEDTIYAQKIEKATG